MKKILAAIAPICICTPSYAQVSEVRAGAAAHDIRVLRNSIPRRENSIALNAEIIFDEPKFLKWALSPQPYIGGTLNVQGDTSYGGAGLLWRQNLGKKFYGDFAFGFVVHDGETDTDILDDIPLDGSLTPEENAAIIDANLATRANRIQYGSRVLFREQLSLGYKFNKEWAVEGYFEHISNASLPDGSNDGSDAAGFRINRRF